jgi:4-amino-4-deoxy-L-arabinose transferase-like glycosyltransferase
MKLGYDNEIRYLFIAFFILLALIPPLYYIHSFLSPDESGFMFIGDSINHGSIPYKDLIDIKPPGIFYLNALIFAVFGKSFYASRIVLYIVNALSALIIYFLGKDLWDEHIGQLSSILFLIGVYNPLIEGYFVLTEQYMVFFGLFGILVFFKFHDWRYLVPVGFFFGIATLFKQPGILFFVLILIYYFSGLLNKENRSKVFIYKLIKSSLLISIGFLIPIFITAVFFYREGVLYDFAYWSFLYFISGKYGTVFDITSLFQPINSLVIIWIPALISVAIIIYNLLMKKVQYNNLMAVWWLLLFGYTLATRQYGHYFIQILPPACILASATLTKVPNFKNMKEFFSKKGAAKILIFIFVILLISHTILWSIFYDQLVGSDRNLVLENQIETSNFIISHTEPNQRIFSVPFDPSVYLLSDRYPPIKYLDLGIQRTPGNEQDDIISQLNKNNVPYIIVNTKFKDWLTQNHYEFIIKNYVNEKTIGIYDIYKRV